MRDIEFLTTCGPFSGAVIYRYRSGVLRKPMIAWAEAAARRQGQDCIHLGYEELAIDWFNENTLFPGVRICDPPQRSSKKAVKLLRSFLQASPASPTLICVRAEKSNDFRHPGVTVVDELLVTSATLPAALRYVAATSDLIGADMVYAQNTFRRYFRRWIAMETSVSLPELMQEFDRAILLHADSCSNLFEPPTEFGPSSPERSQLISALAGFLVERDATARAGLLRAVASRKNRGSGDDEIVADLLVASHKMLLRCERRGDRRSERGYAVSIDVAMLWGALMLAWGAPARAGSAQEIARARNIKNPILLELERFCQDFQRRAHLLADNPLDGCWSLLSELASHRLEIEAKVEADPELELPTWVELFRSLMANAAGRRGYAWLDQLARLKGRVRPAWSAPAEIAALPDRDLRSFEEIVGQDHIVARIRRRFEADQHGQALLLIGPSESGKRAIARLYAKALLCEERSSSSIDPCGRCEVCKNFETSDHFGYLEIDMGMPNVLATARKKIEEFRFRGFSNRRAVILRKPNVSDEAGDAFLKVIESKDGFTTFILLAEDERLVRSAVLSRSTSVRIRKIDLARVRPLLERWLPSDRLDDRLVELIWSTGEGRPGLMRRLSQRVIGRSAWTLSEAKRALGLDWGERALGYLDALLAGRFEEAQGLLARMSFDSVAVPGYVMAGLSALDRGDASGEPAFLGLETRLGSVIAGLERRACSQGVAVRTIWESLAGHWRNDAVSDLASLLAAGRKAASVASRSDPSPCPETAKP